MSTRALFQIFTCMRIFVPLNLYSVAIFKKNFCRAKKAEALNKQRRSLPPMSATPVAPQLQPLQAQNDLPGSLTRSNSIAPFTTLAPKVGLFRTRK